MEVPGFFVLTICHLSPPFQNHPTHYFLFLRRFLTLPTFDPKTEVRSEKSGRPTRKQSMFFWGAYFL